MKWAIEIKSTGLDKRNISDLLGDIGYQVVEIDGVDLAVTSDSLANCTIAEEVWEKAKKLRAIFVETEIDSDFKLGSVFDLSAAEPKRTSFLELKSEILAPAFGSSLTLTALPSPELTEEERLIREREQKEREYQAKLETQRATLIPASREPRAVKMLALMRRDQHTGESLYKMYELMEGPTSNRSAFHTKFGVLDNEFARFKDAVHNPNVHGNFARHAQADKLNSVNPMTKEQARSFVYALAERWLASLR